MKILLFGLVALVAATLSSAVAAADVGVVFMHGKWGNNQGGPTAQLVRRIEGAGFAVEFPNMPWSERRSYDRDVDGALAEIDEAVERLRKKGATKIVVGGQSLGANVAMIYGSRRDGLAGILAVSPGHTPELASFRNALGGDVARAKEMVAAGKGADKATFLDINQGQRKSLRLEASSYLSWMDPSGPAVIQRSAARMKPGAAFMWVIGDQDGLHQQGRAYAFDRVPENPKNSYIVVGGGAHADSGNLAAQNIIAWLKTL